jgi:isoleucyl-tRNA synthetase
LDSEQQDFTQNIIEILNTSKISIKPCNNEMLNRLYLSRVNTLKWLLGKSNDNDNDNDLDKLKRIILCKIQQLKKEKKKTIYRIETIRIIQEIDNLEFCLNALVQHTNNKINLDK